MFILEGKPLSLDIAFTTPDGTQYPANWLRLASPEQREAIGITEQSDPPVWDQRYFWGYDADGNLIPKQLEDLKTLHIQQTKETANTLLAPTDWYIVRKFERNIDVPVGIVSYRAAVIEVSEERETLIESVTTVEELKGLYESSATGIGTEEVIVPPAMPNWPSINSQSI
jgi:hypothetical protein